MQDCHLLEGAPRSGEDRPLRSKGAARGGILKFIVRRAIHNLRDQRPVKRKNPCACRAHQSSEPSSSEPWPYCGLSSFRAKPRNRPPPREALIKSLSDFILAFLFNARNKSTRIASYLRRLMTQHWIKIHMKFDSAN